MPILNNSVIYFMRIEAHRPKYNPIVFDYIVGGFASKNTERIELG